MARARRDRLDRDAGGHRQEEQRQQRLGTVHGSTDRPGTISGTASGISSTVPMAAISMKAAV